MISLSKILSEERTSKSIEYGCLMAEIPASICNKLVTFGNKLISEEDLYKEGEEFGREKECHVTIKYGFTGNLNAEDIKSILDGVVDFKISINKIGMFSSKDKPFDVVKFDVVKDEALMKLNKRCNEFPHEDTYPGYNPHVTIAYVKKGKFKHGEIPINLVIPIHTVCYSTVDNKKSYYKV